MRSCTALICMLLPVFDAAFVPAASGPVCSRSTVPLAAAPEMVSAKEVYGQLYEASPPVQKSLQALPPPVAKGAMAGLVAATGYAGFLLTPSRRLAVNTVGGVLTAGLGNIARKRLSDERQKAAVPAVAAILAEGLPSVKPEALAAIATEYSVPKKQFDAQLSELYLAFLSATLTTHVVETAELSEVLRLQALLKLSAAQVGTQIYKAARQLYSRHRAYLEDTEPNDSKLLLQKFVFLAERILARDESPEGYRYESLRLQKLFSITQPEWRAMAEAAAVPFYQKALNSAVLESKPATPQQLESMVESLGISDGCAEGMHEDVLRRCATEMLAEGRLADADKDRLGAVQALLGMDTSAASVTLRALTAPLYASTFEEALGEIAGLNAEADDRTRATLTGKLSQRQQELLLLPADVVGIETDALRAAAVLRLDEALKYLRAQNLPQGLVAVQSLVSFCETMAGFMIDAEHTTGPVDNALQTLFQGLTTDGMKQSEKLSLYRVTLLQYLESLKVSEEQGLCLARLRVILGLADAETTSIYQAAAGPLYRKTVVKATEAELSEAAKAELQASLVDLALPSDVTTDIAVDIYGERLRSLASDSKILDEQQSAQLTSLRDFLSISMDDVADVHEECFAPAYLDSVRQVMGTTGVIPDEYWDGLTKLRARLGLSEESAQALFATEVTAKMKTFAAKAIEAMEEKMKSQSERKESTEAGGGSLGMEGALSTEVLNLVDFAVASKALYTKTVGNKEVEFIGASLRDELEDRTRKELYKQFLVEAFSGSDATQNERLFNNLNRLALVLGLEDGDVNVIHNEIGGVIYRQYISRALQKGPLGQEEKTFLTQIKNALGMDEARCTELVRDQELSRVSVLVETMFEKPSVLAEDVRKMRDAADQFDVDLKEDLQVSQLKLDRFFRVELEDLVESDELRPDDLGALEELCEPLHISESAAQRMLEETVQARVSSGLLQAAASQRQQALDAAVAQLNRMLQYASLMECKAEAPAVSQAERSELFMLFQANMLGNGGGGVDGTAKLELLKSVMGIAVAV